MAFKRMIGLLLAALLCFGACAAAEETDAPQFVMAGYDSTQYRDWLNNQFFKRMEERTGVRFVYQQYTDAAAWQKAKDAMTAGSDSLPDVLFKASLGGAECIELRGKGRTDRFKALFAGKLPQPVGDFRSEPR
jgi:ABC-type glycerol-3-phosphate transport system substrate-binding protein